MPLGALQFASGLFLLWDILGSILGIRSAPIAWVYYELAQIGAVIGLILGTAVSATLLLRSIRRQHAAEESLRLASGAFMDVLHERFDDWELTPAERDVALFSIKGLSTAEIAGLRNTSEGTVKAQTNAIYRKAGVNGRPQLLSLFIDELMSDPLAGVTSEEVQRIDKAS
ncbi:helix-turn-helix transcriptional regulator [Marivita hallyeonensis]|uniref:Regulatory protein, luxR family n=1 Tax=Marivita hallyeonensis TaxID=996342 RepID=A0A1M5NS09_9RHOB|nr:helix-turn-helix transcriptional regulator [Marivita hallyeonensis]SHG92258.1 regulatory protein, luxR family [Marivita hallyeonensis]